MAIDRNKVLYGNPMKAIRIRHRALTEQASITREAARTYYEAYADKDMKLTLEASRYIFSEPIVGLKYYKEYLESHTIPLFSLRTESAKLDEFINQYQKHFSPAVKKMYESVSDMLHTKINGLKHSIVLSESAEKDDETKSKITEIYDKDGDIKPEAVEDTIKVDTNTDSNSNNAAQKPESAIAKFHKQATATASVKEEGGSDEIKFDDKTAGGTDKDLVKEAEKLQKNPGSVMESADETVCLEATFPDVMYYMLEHSMSYEISNLLDWHFTESPTSVRAFKEAADVVMMTRAMLKDSYICEKVNALQPAVAQKVRDIASINPSELVSTVTVESGNRESVIYVDPMQAMDSMELDSLISESVDDPMDAIHRKLCIHAVCESVLTYKTILEDSDDILDDIDDEDLDDISDEDLEKYAMGFDDDILDEIDEFELPEEEACNESAGCKGFIRGDIFVEKRTVNSDPIKGSKVVRTRDDEDTDKKKVAEKLPKEDDEDLGDDDDDLGLDEEESTPDDSKKPAAKAKDKEPKDPGPAPKQAVSTKAMDASMKGMSKGNAVKDAAGEAKRTAIALSKVPGAIIDGVKRQIDDWEKMGDDKRKQKMLEPGFRKNYYKKMRHALEHGLAFAINPLLNIMVFLVHYCNKERDARLRNELLHELEAEVKICEEKIRDADSGEDKKKKYQLMRTKDKLQAEIVRVRTNSRYI